MNPGPVRTVADGGVVPIARQRRPQRGPLRLPPKAVDVVPDEPTAVVLVGPSDEARAALRTVLIGEVPVARPGNGGLLLVRHGAETAGLAHIPGHRQPRPCTAEAVDGPVPARPPRRVEVTLSDPLLRHFSLVDTPETGSLGIAGTRVVLDAATRGGAILYVTSATRRPAPADLDLLAGAARAGCDLFFAVLPEVGGWVHHGRDVVHPTEHPATLAIRRHRESVEAAVPAAVGLPWYAVDPATGDVAYLRRALIEWADREGLARASVDRPPPHHLGRTVRVARDAHESDWADRLERQLRNRAHRLRQHLAIELANIHLRCVQQIVFGAGPTALPEALDREVESLSLLAVNEGDAAVAAIVDEAVTRVFGEAPDEGVRRRVAAAVRRGFADHRLARDLDRVLLVTSTGGVATVTGPEAVAALAAYPITPGRTILPPIGVALSGGCYQLWRNPGHDEPGQARSWLQRALREIENELTREVTRRFEAVRLSLTAVLADAVDHGILLS
ncbi:hypothetical protein [Plantactinospora sp. GCM10030261]|uniref:hypothetical protein n=1 Tax=Plantactinospora sp. GCM10030261 TaxID=3273420 RepID=UPI003615624C